MPGTPQIYSTTEVAELLGVTRRTAVRYAQALGVPQAGANYVWTDEWVAKARQWREDMQQRIRDAAREGGFARWGRTTPVSENGAEPHN